MKIAITVISSLSLASLALAGPYAPPAGQVGSTAVSSSSPSIVEWASGFQNLVRGPQDIANPSGPLATVGTGSSALGAADGTGVVSLGDGGQITLTFAQPITNGAGADFAVFENSFSDTFLELAFVEVSSNGADFLRFPAVSLTQTAIQISNAGSIDATNLDDLAGKYKGGFGTPFDLAELAGLSLSVDVDRIRFVRVVDVVGSINPALGTNDSLGNRINDPYPTAFASSGFDLDAVAVLHMVPEPAAWQLLVAGAIACWAWARRRR